MNMPFPESMKEAEAMDYAFGMMGEIPRYTAKRMVREGWGRLSLIWTLSPTWEDLSDTGKLEFMRHYWKYRLGVSHVTRTSNDD